MRLPLGPALVCTVLLASGACASEARLALGEPQVLAPAHAADPTVAVDKGSGVVYATWMAMQPDSSWQVMIARSNDQGRVGEPVAIPDTWGSPTSTKEFPPQVVVGDDGAVYVAWISRQTVPGRTVKTAAIRVSRSTDGGRTFAAPVSVSTDGPNGPLNLYYDIAAGAPGVVAVSWLDLGHYGKQSMAEEHGDSAMAHALAAEPIEGELRYARSTDGGQTYHASATLDSMSCICCRTAITIGATGDAFLLWRHVFPGEIRDFVVSRIDSTNTAGTRVRVHEDQWHHIGCPDIGPDIAAESGGLLHVAWYTGAPGRQGLHYTTSRDAGRTFQPPTDILTGTAVPTSEVKLAVANGRPWLVWEEKTPKGSTLKLGHVESGVLRPNPEPVGNGISPAIAAGAGRLAVVWSDSGRVVLRITGIAPEGGRS